jgi:AraC-like DNA-binding protein
MTTTSALADARPGLSGVAGEHHYTPKEIAQRWGLSESKVRRMFEVEPGVLRIGEPSRRVGRKLRRAYFIIRIPESVALRVHRRLTGAGRKA